MDFLSLRLKTNGSRRGLGVWFGLVLGFWIVAPSCLCAAGVFITRSGDKLMEGNRVFRFVSFNVPELTMRETPWSKADPFEQEDAVKTIAQTSGRVVRTYVFSVGGNTRHPAHIEGVRTYNDELFRSFDHMLALCGKYGIRVIIPFIDLWSHWGGIREFAGQRNKPAGAFFRDSELKEDYKDLVHYVLTRKNSETGLQYKDDPTILAWETGNELRNADDAWTREMAAYFKSIDPNHLVMDGRDVSISPASLEDPNVDIVSNHYYGEKMVENFREDYKKTAGRKPLVAGEFGLVAAPKIMALVDEIVRSEAAGALLWSLRQHATEGGFLWHREGETSFYAYHFPGFAGGEAYDEKPILAYIQEKARQMGGTSPAPQAQKTMRSVLDAPTLLPIKTPLDIRWQGSVGAHAYAIERSTDGGKSWQVVGSAVSDGVNAPEENLFLHESGVQQQTVERRILFQDYRIRKGHTYHYRVKALGEGPSSGYSNIEATKFEGFDDGIYIEEIKNPRTKGQFLFRAAGPIRDVCLELPAGSRPKAKSSRDGQIYKALAGERYPSAKGDSFTKLCAANVPDSAKFLKITFTSGGKGSTQGPVYLRMALGQARLKIEAPNVPLVKEMIEDGETHGDSNSALRDSFNLNLSGGEILLTLDTAHKIDGKYGLRYDYDFGTAGYGGLTKSFLPAGADFRGKRAIQFWFMPDGSANKLVIQFKESNGEYWEYALSMTSPNPTQITLPWDKFTQPGWGGKGDGKLDLSNISEISLYVNKTDASLKSSGTIYFDNFGLQRP